MKKKFKRQYRERDTETKMKISNALKNRTKSASHCQAISQGLKNYWETVPSKNNEDVKPLNNNGKM